MHFGLTTALRESYLEWHEAERSWGWLENSNKVHRQFASPQMVQDPMVFRKHEQLNLTRIRLKTPNLFLRYFPSIFWQCVCSCGNPVVLSSPVDSKAKATSDFATPLGDPLGSAPLFVPSKMGRAVPGSLSCAARATLRNWLPVSRLPVVLFH